MRKKHDYDTDYTYNASNKYFLICIQNLINNNNMYSICMY